MHDDAPYPLRLRPVYKDYLWGGGRIAAAYGRTGLPKVCAESWEVSDRPEGMCVVANGARAGQALHRVVEDMGPALLGHGPAPGRFPLLIKVIDAHQRLSVQVHPDDASAARDGGEAKTEMWYLLDAESGAQVFAGLRPGVDEAQFRAAVRDETVGALLEAVPVSRGDAVFMPGGTVHAIDAGCLILEVQQNSNTTYRIHDWGRVGPDGRPRPLHLEASVRAMRWGASAAGKLVPQLLEEDAGCRRWLVAACPHFRMERLALSGPRAMATVPETCTVLFDTSGRTRLQWGGGHEALAAGDTVLLPAALGAYTLVPDGGDAGLLAVTAPGPAMPA